MFSQVFYSKHLFIQFYFAFSKKKQKKTYFMSGILKSIFGIKKLCKIVYVADNNWEWTHIGSKPQQWN